MASCLRACRSLCGLYIFLGLLNGLSDNCLADNAAKLKDSGSKATAAEIAALLRPIANEFSSYRSSGITKGMVERAYCSEHMTTSVRVQVKDGKLYATPTDDIIAARYLTVLHQMAHMSSKYDLPDLDAVLILNDLCPGKDIPFRSHEGNSDKCPHVGPYLSGGKRLGWDHCISIPDFTFQGWPEHNIPPWSLTRTLLSSAADDNPWQKRNKTLFWKGADSHAGRVAAARSQKLRKSGKAAIILTDHARRWETFVSLPDHCQYKFLLSHEGYVWSTRLKYLMACGSTIVAPTIIFHEFWYHMLNNSNIVFVRDVNAENDGQPLLDAVDALLSNDAEAEAIAKAGKHLAVEVLHEDNVDRYLLEVLKEYSRLMTFKVELHPDVVPISLAMMRHVKILDISNRTCNYC